MTVTVASPFPEYAWPLVWGWIETFRDRVTDDFGPKTLEDFMDRQLSRRGVRKTWGVYRAQDGRGGSELGGLIEFEPSSPIAGNTHCLFKRSFWGPRTTDESLRLVYSEIFAAGVVKTSSVVFADNFAIRSLAGRIGATVNPYPLRSHTRRGGELVDMVLIELFAKEFYLANGIDRPGTHSGRLPTGGPVRIEEGQHIDGDVKADLLPGPDESARGPVHTVGLAPRESR